MPKSGSYRKFSVSVRDIYLIVTLEKNLTDTEFLQLDEVILQRTTEDSIEGVIIDLKALDVIDSYATRILHKITTEKQVPIILSGIKPVVAKTMEKQGLKFPEELVHLEENVTSGILKLEKLK